MKEIYTSKTVWFNIFMTIVLSAQLVGGMYQEYAGVSALIAGLGNVVLRVWFTSEPIKK